MQPGTMIYPLPAVMVSCGATPDEHNIITIAWTGTICSKPPMCYISVRKNRHSYNIIKEQRDFVINLTTENLVFPTDWCGIRSGRDYSKFDKMNLTPGKASKVKSPIINESPVNIECEVRQIIPLGTHDMFVAEVVAVLADEQYFKPGSLSFQLEKANPICYATGKYFSLGDELGDFGFSVRNPEKGTINADQDKKK